MKRYSFVMFKVRSLIFSFAFFLQRWGAQRWGAQRWGLEKWIERNGGPHDSVDILEQRLLVVCKRPA